MSINVHRQQVQEYLDKGYVITLIQRWVRDGEEFERFDLEHPDDACLHAMRRWVVDYTSLPGGNFKGKLSEEQPGLCVLDKDHRGRHATSCFVCDVCDKARRGSPPYYDADVAVCWFCRNIGYGRAS